MLTHVSINYSTVNVFDKFFFIKWQLKINEIIMFVL